MSDDWLSDEVLAAWPGGEPPEGFADRVLSARGSTRVADEPPVTKRPPRRGAGWRVGALVGVAAVIAIGLFLFLRAGHRPTDTAGAIAAAPTRQSIQLGGHGVAVVEPGATLSWTTDARGGIHVMQRAGGVFYRVEHGGPFVVETGAGTVTVHGTCFRVEVADMHSKVKLATSAVAGATVGAALVLVLVYEGKIRVSNAHGAVDAVAGDNVVMSPGEGPRRDADHGGPTPMVAAQAAVAIPGLPADLQQEPPATATREQLLAREQQLRSHIGMLERQMGELAKRANGGKGGREPVYDLPPDQWKQLAEKCEVRFDNPGFGLEAPKLSAKDGAELGLSDAEVVALNEALADENALYTSAMRQLYIEITGDQTGAESLDVQAMAQEIQKKTPSADNAAARRRIALEHAGVETPPVVASSGPAIDRYFRLVVGEGDAVEKRLAGIIGPDRAAQFRDKLYQQRNIMNGCGDGTP